MTRVTGDLVTLLHRHLGTLLPGFIVTPVTRENKKEGETGKIEVFNFRAKYVLSMHKSFKVVEYQTNEVTYPLHTVLLCLCCLRIVQK